MCKFTRTANAGGLLELDGRSILLDGICDGAGPYLPTPPGMLDALLECKPDLMVVTHAHPDHLAPDAAVECLFAWGGIPVLGTRDVARILSPWPVVVGEAAAAGPVGVAPIPSRHIGAARREVEHVSFLLKGSRRCFFLGDAAPLQWKGWTEPLDVLFAPFAYAATNAGWRVVEELSPQRLVLLHMPARDYDPGRLWNMEGLSHRRGIPVTIPEMGETVDF